MSATIQPGTSADRFGFAILLAALFHALLIFGIQFQALESPDADPETLRVSLVMQPNLQKPEPEAPVAAADHVGGGELVDQGMDTGIQPRPEPPKPPAPAAAPQPPPPVPQISETAPAEQPGEVVTTIVPAPSAAPPKPETPPELPDLSPNELMRQARQLAQLETPVPPDAASQGEDPNSFGATSRFDVREAYIEAWERKVEDWGTRNFPDAARRDNLTGSLSLTVVVRRDGNVERIELIRSSGHEVLDDAAFNIVALAAPYAPFPEELRERHGDYLRIQRTWQFLQGNRLDTR
jgi:protein TonB